jgi:16S rRNA (guanine527-N7)-methyltransferase
VDIILKYFDKLTLRQIEQFEMLAQLYNDWNAKINVVSRKDIDELYTRHVLHSLAIAKIINFRPGTKVLDVGCGGGFPGIPLAIMFPETQFTLVDSIGKKIKVVNEVANALSLTNVEGIQQRAEKMKHRYHFIVSRAVTAFPKFVALTRKLIDHEQFNALHNGIIYLKGGDFTEEIADFKNCVTIHNIPDFFEESFFETKKVIYLPL